MPRDNSAEHYADAVLEVLRDGGHITPRMIGKPRPDLLRRSRTRGGFGMALSNKRVKAMQDRRAEIDAARERKAQLEADAIREVVASAKRMLIEAGEASPVVVVNELSKPEKPRRWFVMSAEWKDWPHPISEEGERLEPLSRRFLASVAKHCRTIIKENMRRTK